MEHLIDIQGLKYRYQTAQQETLAISEFRVEKGESIFLYGPSGSGKTTLLEILAGILKPQKGVVKILGQDLSAKSETERDQFRGEHLGYIFQNFNLIPYLSVRENIELPIRLSARRRSRIDIGKLENIISDICDRLGILSVLERRVTELSIGQQQRVAVARALVGQPDLILADEPTSSLDMDHREKFLNLLFDLCKQYGASLLFVSHDRSIQHMFSRTVFLSDINKITP